LKGKIDLLHFSLDSFSPEQHNHIRGVPCYDFVLKSIDIALALDEKPDILFTVTPDNFKQIEAVYYRLANYYGLILILNPLFAYNQMEGRLTEKVFEELKRWQERPGVFLNQALIDLRKKGGNQIENPVCQAGNAVVVISPDNELLLPCYHRHAFRFPINNNLHELWNSPEVKEARAFQGRLEACQGCAINCYMQPSFSYAISPFFWKSLPSTFNYFRDKWISPKATFMREPTE
jgi:MoaA/NifB/PqqE/SkfB family radical SAM enzyme